MTAQQRPAPTSLFSRATSAARGQLVAAALAAGLVSALIAHYANVLSYYVSQSLKQDYLALANDYFFFSTALGFLLLSILGLFGIYHRWYTAMLGGLLAGALGAVLGTVQTALSGGASISADLLGGVIASLGNLNLILVLGFTVATGTAGIATFHRVQALGSRTRYRRNVLIVRAPAANLAEGAVTHIERRAVDPELAGEQWADYISVLENAGWQVVEADAKPELADSVFIEDALVIVDDLAIITRPGAEHRRAETAGLEDTVNRLGLEPRWISGEGTLDGGDVLKVGTTIYIGRSGRTNAEGIRQFREILSPRGYTVIPVPVTRALHLKSAVTALPDGTLIGYPPLVDDPSLFERFRPVPEAHGAAVVVLDESTVLMSSSAVQTIAMLEELGFVVIPVDISEFEKLEGCVTCLSVRVR